MRDQNYLKFSMVLTEWWVDIDKMSGSNSNITTLANKKKNQCYWVGLYMDLWFKSNTNESNLLFFIFFIIF